jgi:hypothetical protein
MSYTNGLDKPEIILILNFILVQVQLKITGVGFQPDLLWLKIEVLQESFFI